MIRTRIRRLAIRAALGTSKALGYRCLSGIVALLVDQGRLIRIGDLIDRVGADELKDGQRSWLGRHVAKAYRAAHGGDAIKVWSQHRTTGKWNHVHAYNPVEPALYAGLATYKATRHLAQTDYARCA
ncbi:hypothetical protein [Streptomyces zhihengii]